MKMFRQGDLLFLKVDKAALPKTMTAVPSGVILKGEATGHSHRLVNGQLFRSSSWAGAILPFASERGNASMIVQAQQGTKVIHEEHATIDLEIGFYLVIRQMEYSPWRLLNVMD